MLAVEISGYRVYEPISKWKSDEMLSGHRGVWFTVYPDVGNLSSGKRRDRRAELGIDRIAAIHLKDTCR